MRKRTLGVVLLAGLAMSGAGAFTGSNNMDAVAGDTTAGYGQVVATGIVVTDMQYAFTADNSAADAITFTTSTAMTNLTPRLTLADTTQEPDLIVESMDCTKTQEAVALGGLNLPLLTGTNWTIVCDLSPSVALTSFDRVGLTVFTTGAAPALS